MKSLLGTIGEETIENKPTFLNSIPDNGLFQGHFVFVYKQKSIFLLQFG